MISTASRRASLVLQNSLKRKSMSTFIRIVEVGPRDGLQNEKNFVSTEQKVELIHRLAAAGVGVIECGSFVSPEWVPQMKDSAQVFEKLHFPHDSKRPQLTCLVPNLKGLEQAIAAKVDEIAIFGSASESFSQRNVACSIEESIARFRDVVEAARKQKLPVRGYVSTVVGCPYEGEIAPSQVAKVVGQMLELGCYEVSLGDTIGVGTPGTINAMLDEVLRVASPSQLALHCHDTYGQALANISAALERGICTFDSSVAGLGGCPYAKGASGNVATEDVVYMFHGMELSTGIHLEKLVDAGEYICHILGRRNQSKVAQALKAKRESLPS